VAFARCISGKETPVMAAGVITCIRHTTVQRAA
jgi:hypothetical protein